MGFWHGGALEITALHQNRLIGSPDCSFINAEIFLEIL